MTLYSAGCIIYIDKGKADNPQTAERVFKMKKFETLTEYEILNATLLYGKIEYTLGELRRDFSLDYQFHCALHDRLFNLSCRTCGKFGELNYKNYF